MFAFPKFIERLVPNSSLMALWAEFWKKTKGAVLASPHNAIVDEFGTSLLLNPGMWRDYHNFTVVVAIY